MADIQAFMRGGTLFETQDQAFANPIPHEGRSFLEENRKITPLIPSEQTQNRVLLLIKRIFTSIFNWFYPFKKRDYTGIVAAFDQNNEANAARHAMLQPHRLLSYFKRFFDADRTAPSEVARCMGHLQEQLEAIQKLEHFMVEDEVALQRLREPLNDWIADVEQLAIGEQKLIIASADRGNELFYLFSKDEEGTHLKIIGRGATMVTLSGIQQIGLSGKVKIPASLSYRQIPIDQIRHLLQCSPLGNSSDLQPLMALLGQFPEPETPTLSGLTTQTDNYRKILQTVCKQIQLNAAQDPADIARSKLRLKVYTLFSILKEYQQSLPRSSRNLQTLARMFHLSAQSLNTAHQKGIITGQELEILVEELGCVKQVIDAAKGTSFDANPIFKLPPMSLNASAPITLAQGIVGAEPLAQPAVRPHPVRDPRTAPALDELLIPHPLEPAMLPPMALHEVPEDASAYQIMKTIYAIDFWPLLEGAPPRRHQLKQPWIGDVSRERIEAWNYLSREEAIALAEKIISLSERLTELSKQPNQFSSEILLSLAKMCSMVEYLDRYRINPRTADRWRTHYSPWRAVEGASIHPHNLTAQIQQTHYDAEQNRWFHEQDIRIDMHLADALPYLHAQRQACDVRGCPDADWEAQNRWDGLKWDGRFGWDVFSSDDVFSRFLNDRKPGLSATLLSAYCYLEIVRHYDDFFIYPPGRDGRLAIFNLNRTTQEAISHDPQASLNEVTNLAMMDIAGRREENWLSNRRLRGNDKKEYDLQAKKVAQYLLRAAALEEDFSEEELTALLSLSRENECHSELIGFMEAHTSMLSRPQVRLFVQQLFFQAKRLTKTLEFGSPHLLAIMPRFFAEKIDALRERLEESPQDANALDQLLFFLQMSDSLQGIYAQIDSAKLPLDGFFPIETLQDQLAALRVQFRGRPVAQEIAARELKILLKQEELSLQEVVQVILIMHPLYPHLESHSTIPFLEGGWLKMRYENLLKRLVDESGQLPLDHETLSYLLDALCQQQGLPLDLSEWRGEGVVFENDQYQIDLLQSTLQHKLSLTTQTTLPADRLADPLFATSFPDIDQTEGILATLEVQADGTKVYRFDQNRGQVQEKEGVYTYYRLFNGRFLQAVSLFSGEEGDRLAAWMAPPPEEEVSLFSHLRQWTQREQRTPKPPALLQQGVFIDPQHPQTGFVISNKGTLEFELELEPRREGVTIHAIRDLRGGERSKAMVLECAAQAHFPALKPLEQFESPEHILLWAEKGNSLKGALFDHPVTTIELPRYGLTFRLEDDRFVCQTPSYAGYAIDWTASLEEKKGFAHAILLRHSDRSKPAKLLIPPASAIVPDIKPPQLPSGPAFVIWLIRSIIEFRFHQTLPFIPPEAGTKIDSFKQHLELIAIDLNPHTHEFVYETGKATAQAQELIQHAVASGNDTLAYQIFQSLPIEKTPSDIQRWVPLVAHFSTPTSAALGLKITLKLHRLIRHDENFKEIRKELKAVQVDLFKTAMAQRKKTPDILRITHEEYQQLASLVKKQDRAYYQFHIQPFLEQEIAFRLPMQPVQGQTINMPPPLVEAPPQDQERPSRIAELEEQLTPDIPIPIEELAKKLTLLEDPVPLIWDTQDLAEYFNEEKLLTRSPATLLRQVIKPKLKELTTVKNRAKARIQVLLTSQDPLEQLAAYAQAQRVATETELMLALMQNDLGTLRDQGLLPAATDLEALKTALIELYDAEIKFHLMTRSKAMALEMSQNDDPLRRSQSMALFDTLTSKRRYLPETHPELLIFEAFHFMTYRESETQGQLELLSAILETPNGITQAGTGSGKSSVLSILRALLKANGQNLVTYKVLPQLYPETLALMQNRFEKTFQKKVYPFQFNLQMPMADGKGRSIFAGIYQRMLETMRDKGCILTDYKSFPLLEEKFWSLNRELLAARAEGIEPTPLQLSHWNYLRKILVLLKHKEDQLMDEFDEPSRPVHRIQIQIQAGPPAPDFMIEAAFDLFNRLLQEAPLGLAQNLQGDISSEIRLECIQRVAEQIAREKATENLSWEQIKNYFLGIEEIPLEGIAPEQRDILVFLKDEFHTYLPLTLSHSGISKYQRSKDGKRILTCVQGEPREAKFGNLIEEINYSLQDYHQQGVAFPTLQTFISAAISDFNNHQEGAEARFNEIIPDISLQALAQLSAQELKDRILQEILPAVNQNPASRELFLRRHLASLRGGGCVVSMTPQDAVSMSRVVSGVSATVGALGALHAQFNTDESKATEIQEAMIARLRRRVIGQPILYNPANPLESLAASPQPLTAIIDGAGAFRAYSGSDVARALLASNLALQKVEYYTENGTLAYVERAGAPLGAKGFYFAQAYTRGADQPLEPDAVALLTVRGPGKMEDLSQQEGRMRHSEQKIVIAVSEWAPEAMRTLDGIIEHKQQNEKEQNKEEFYKGKAQGLQQTLRTTASDHLLPIDELDPFLDNFDRLQPLFVHPPSPSYATPGDYAQRHHAITPQNCTPLEELRALKAQLIERADQLELSAEALEGIDLPDDLSEKLPEEGSPLTTMQFQQLEVEEEREEQNELEEEQELEIEEERIAKVIAGPKVASYLPRPQGRILYSVAEKMHPSFDPKIQFTNTFLPLERQDPLHRRTPFDDRMHRIGVIRVVLDRNTLEVSSLDIGDLLDYNPKLSSIPPLILGPVPKDFLYDVRTRKIIWSSPIVPEHALEVVNDPEFRAQVAQIRFMDGQIDGYTEEELDDLTLWVQDHDHAQEIRQFFEQQVLRNRPEVRARYRHSPLWNWFQQQGTYCTIRAF